MDHVWELLEQRHEDQVTLPEPLRQALWAHLLQRLMDISICAVERRSPAERYKARPILVIIPRAPHYCSNLTRAVLMRVMVTQGAQVQGKEEESRY